MNLAMEQSSCFVFAQQTKIVDDLWFPFHPLSNNILKWKYEGQEECKHWTMVNLSESWEIGKIGANHE